MVSLVGKSSSAEGPRHIQVSPLTLTVGAEISRVDLKRPLSPEQLKEVRAALLRWKVIFFRGQHLDHAQHIAFAQQFGAPTIGHVVFGNVAEYPEVYSVAKVRAGNGDQDITPRTPWYGWHTDITAAINPPAASILRGVTIPPYGGDTYWTNLAAAYGGLSKLMRDFVDGLRGIHKFVPRDNAGGMEYNDLIKKRELETEHPLVTIHPETGERVLYVSPSFLTSIVGLTPRESQKILEILWEHITRSDYTVRFKWGEGDVAFWDNRATSHLAPTDILDSDFDRLLYRVTIVGEIPTGVDGRASRSVKGEPIFSAAHELEQLKTGAGRTTTDV
jgi:alpha-ketoglutarate-dependent sulfate ester dioxygenase